MHLVFSFGVRAQTEMKMWRINPLPTVMHNCNVYVEAIIIISGTIQTTFCVFRIISPIVK